MSLDLVRGLYDYHWWANRRLCQHVDGLGEELAGRDVGPQFSMPSVLRMLAHIYGADAIWLARWKGSSPASLPGGDIATLTELRGRWDALEAEQRAFLDSLAVSDLTRSIAYRSNEGQPFRLPLGPLLRHVANHATHHRSEVATMVTMLRGSPPDTGIVSYELMRTGQVPG
jgi:uncharacterized damage-inducible protein DinB